MKQKIYFRVLLMQATIMLLMLLGTANAYWDVEGHYYDITWSSFYCWNGGKSIIYIEENDIIYTPATDTSNFTGLPQNYSPFKWGRFGLGGTDVYYILVYDGSNDSNNKYDTIMLDVDKDFSADYIGPYNLTNNTFSVGTKNYALLSIANDGTKIVLKPILNIDATKFCNDFKEIKNKEIALFGDPHGTNVNFRILDIKGNIVVNPYPLNRSHYNPSTDEIWLNYQDIYRVSSI